MLKLQDPTDPASPHVFESLLAAASEAVHGGGAFAFASADGASLLLEDADFSQFLKRGSFDLVVGVDAVTNVKALERLEELTRERKSLTARVFLHGERGALFHPKFSWFQREDGSVRVLAGSGNLTLGGMRGNWEAFQDVEYPAKSGSKIVGLWKRWIARHDSRLLDPTSDAAREAALGNRGWTSKRRVDLSAAPDEAADLPAGSVEESMLHQPMLVAEIGAGPRWKQANFPIRVYEDFFEVPKGVVRHVVLQEVRADGTRLHPESRLGVQVKSQNYRIELGAASGRAYPKTGRPIALFLKRPGALFPYELHFPGSTDHNALDKFLRAKYKGPDHHLRRVIVDAHEVHEVYPACRLLSPTDED